MKSANLFYSAAKRRASEGASVRIILLAAISFLMGVAATAVWFHLTAKRMVLNSNQAGAPSAVQSAAPAAPSAGVNSSAQLSAEKPSPVAPADIEEVKRALPNYASLSLNEGTEILRQTALKNFAAATQEMQNQIAKAQEELSQAESKSPADQQAAMKHLQQVQEEQTQKLQEIARRLQAQIDALKSLKSQE
jgi:septal ring factor EnvC (AmiA/AmiB activator)